MNRMLYMLLGLIGLFSLSGLILAQGSSGFFLHSANSTGGGGSSENGRFSLHGTIEQQANSSLSGGSYTVREGIWSTVCLKAAGVTGPTIEIENSKVKLDWTNNSNNLVNIYRANNDPYFTPSSTYDTDDTAPWIDNENSSINNPVNNQTYLVRVSNSCGESEISKRVGEFDFTIVPGN